MGHSFSEPNNWFLTNLTGKVHFKEVICVQLDFQASPGSVEINKHQGMGRGWGGVEVERPQQLLQCIGWSLNTAITFSEILRHLMHSGHDLEGTR